MNIGGFRNVNGVLLGSVATAALHLPKLGLKPVQSDNPNAPAFEVVALNPGRVWVRVGAVWEAQTGQGEVFYQGRIDDPSMSEPLPIALFRNDEQDGTEAYAVAWSRPKKRVDEFGGTADRRRPRQDAGSGNGGAFTGNATEDGQLADETGNGGPNRDTRGRFAPAGAGAGFGEDLDDQVPF